MMISFIMKLKKNKIHRLKKFNLNKRNSKSKMKMVGKTMKIQELINRLSKKMHHLTKININKEMKINIL